MRGATEFACNMTTEFSFNPRTREGCDKVPAGTGERFEVSIHAPVRGATGSNGNKVAGEGFQSTHP